MHCTFLKSNKGAKSNVFGENKSGSVRELNPDSDDRKLKEKILGRDGIQPRAFQY